MCIEDPASCAGRLREAMSWDGPVIIECVVDEHEPPIPAKVKKDSFAASPGHAIPDAVGTAAGKVVDKLTGRERSDDQ